MRGLMNMAVAIGLVELDEQPRGRDLDSLTAEVDLWVGSVLHNRSSFDTAIKMVDECAELLHALHHDEGNVAGECADVLILLLDIAFLSGVDLQAAFEEKMEINRNRTWKQKQGTLTHEKENRVEADR